MSKTVTGWIVATRGMQDSSAAEEAGYRLGPNEALVVKAEDYNALRAAIVAVGGKELLTTIDAAVLANT